MKCPDIAVELEHLCSTSEYDSDDDLHEEPRAENDEEAQEMEVIDEIVESVQNTDEEVPSTNSKVAFPIDKHDKTLFYEGVNVAGGIDVCVEKIARLMQLKTALNNAGFHIGTKFSHVAKQKVKKKIDVFWTQLGVLTGRRRELLKILIRTQETLEDNLNWGHYPTLSQLGLTVQETEEDVGNPELSELSLDMSQENDDHEYPEEEVEANPEAEVLNLSEPGLCALEK